MSKTNLPDLSNNPWTAFFPTVQAAQGYAATWRTDLEPKQEENVKNKSDEESAEEKEKKSTNRRIEEIFLISLDKNSTSTGRPSRLVFLEDLFESLKEQLWMDADGIEQAVFERLMMEEPSNHIFVAMETKGRDPSAAAAAGETNPLRYLFESFNRLKQLARGRKNAEQSLYKQCENVIIMNAKLIFQHPEFFPMELKPANDFISIFTESLNSRDSDITEEFFLSITEEIHANRDEGTLMEILRPVLDVIKTRFTQLKLGDRDVFAYLSMTSFFTKSQALAEVFMTYNLPRDINSGRAYEETLLGTILSISCIVKNDTLGPFDFFNNPSRFSKQDHDQTESNIHQPLVYLNEQVYLIIYNMLKASADVKHVMLDWLGGCMQANKGRAKIWTNEMMPMLFNQMYASDGFFLNLCAVLLRLCKPFSEPLSPKLLKIQPSYCKATVGDRQQLKNRNVHIQGMEETGLIPPLDAENERIQLEDNYNFVTECFFMTHYALNLGFHVIHKRLLKLNQNLHRIQTVYRDILGSGAQDSELGQRMKEQMEKGMMVFLCLKAAMTESQLLELCMTFHVSTACYLNHLGTAEAGSTSFAPISFPLAETPSPTLSLLPEFVAENVLDFMMFIKRFKDSVYEYCGDKLEHLMTLVLVYMGSPERMRNPHLRARLAEALEALMPPKQDDNQTLVSHFKREELFHTHPHITQLAPTLLHVFVSIEMTGSGVEFEEKFNYRRPMYNILEYLLNVDKHKDSIKELAVYAEGHIEDTNAPLFLSFINLLINDAIYLLDEALQYMAQIREKQEARDSGAWSELPPEQKQEQENNLKHMGMLAKFHNMMSNDTIHSIEMISRDIKSIFINDVIVDRIAAMLNYFLLNLVGPKKKNLKVKDFGEFEFKPQEIVSNICQIYINLGADSDEFCLAVSRDGRSYSPGLFRQADMVLRKIHRPQEMIIEMADIAAKIKAMSTAQAEEEEVLADAPEEFLDPIMGTLMRDPVLLPTSGNIVDRTTIARHILSDQSDPFNRQALTMDMVVQEEDLKNRIHAWITDNMQRAAAAEED